MLVIYFKWKMQGEKLYIVGCSSFFYKMTRGNNNNHKIQWIHTM